MQQPTWITNAGSLGNFPSLTSFEYQLTATPNLPAVSIVSYTIISGSLPTGLKMNTNGLITGIFELVTSLTSSTFVVRVIDNYGNIADRTFSITVSGSAVPSFITPPGNIGTILDSTFTNIQIQYNNPLVGNPISIRKISGRLPPGLEINSYGLIRGYAKPPITNSTLPSVVTYVISTSAIDNVLTCLTTAGMSPGRPILFSGTLFGGLNSGKTYYIKSVINDTDFTLTGSVNGPVISLVTGSGYMTSTLPAITVGQPTNQSYSFTLQLDSPTGSATQVYSIAVINQNTPVSQGGPGYPNNTRKPTIYNTQPETYKLDSNMQEYGYYVIPPNSTGNTYSPSAFAFINTFTSGNNFNFKILGHDFDGNLLTYHYSALPLGLVGDPVTGWITGTPVTSGPGINEFNFSVYVTKASNPSIVSDTYNFSFKIKNTISGNITWISSPDLGVIYNGTTSVKQINAVSDVPISYTLVSGTLPPSLTLLPTGELSGIVSFQPESTIQPVGKTNTFTFTVQAYSPTYPLVQSEQEFTISVYQWFPTPLDTLYCKCTPSISDRYLIASLLNNTVLIPNEFLYRPNDPFFGKAANVEYQHAYGIFSNNLDAYIAAISKKNHYWRNITLGEIKTAIARDENTGEILYEVVYSEVIDNLVAYNEIDRYQIESQSNIITPYGESVSRQVNWPRPIPLFLGPWYDSETTIYTDYEGKDSPPPTYYTSRTPGFATELYPNSLPNMRQQVADVLGQQTDYHVLPLWMSSQQPDGSTYGFTPAWVIAYCKPGVTTLPDGTSVSYAQYIQYQIQNNWKNEYQGTQTLNTINFKLDRFTVNKSASYNFDNSVSPAAFTTLPGASPTPNPIDSKDFYVLFPRETILPDSTQIDK